MSAVEDGVENLLPGVPEAQEYYASPPGVRRAAELGPGTVVGSYRRFSDAVTAG